MRVNNSTIAPFVDQKFMVWQQTFAEHSKYVLEGGAENSKKDSIVKDDFKTAKIEFYHESLGILAFLVYPSCRSGLMRYFEL